MSKIKWNSKKFEIDDKKSILDLRLKIFKEPQYNEKRWDWQYLKNPNGKGQISLAVDILDQSLLAGHYAVIPYKLSWNNKETSSAQSLDTFTNPDYQRQGIFNELAESNYKDCQEAKIEIIFGFPNQASYGGFVKKLNFYDPFGFKVFRKPLRLGYFSNRFFKNKILSKIPLNFKTLPANYKIEKIETISEKIIPLLEKFNNLFPFMVLRKLDYLHWRYDLSPDRFYKKYFIYKENNLVGFFVLGFDLVNQYSHLVDFAIASIDDFKIILEAAIHTSKNEEMVCITFFTNENNKFESSLKSYGFNAKDKSEQFRFILRNLENNNLISEAAKTSSNWLITPGDTDFY